jgi:hypothetical protein
MGNWFMEKRALRVVKWLSTTPAVGVCAFCSQQFKVPMSSLSRTMDAQANLQQRFDAHKCKPLDSSQNALRISAKPRKPNRASLPSESINLRFQFPHTAHEFYHFIHLVT